MSTKSDATTSDLITAMVRLRLLLRDAPENLALQKITSPELETLFDQCDRLARGLRHHLDAPEETPDQAVAAGARAFDQAGEVAPEDDTPDLLTLAEPVLRPHSQP